MEKISSTDIECLWNALKPSVNMMYLPFPLQDFCCVYKSSLKSLQLTEDVATFFQKQLFSICPDSAVVRHCEQKFQRKETTPVSSNMPSTSSGSSHQKDQILKSLIFKDLCFKTEHKAFLSSSDEKYFFTEVCINQALAVELALGEQGTVMWLGERQKRITSSVAYSLYTYAKNKKLRQNTFHGNSNTLYGQTCEAVARDVFTKKWNCNVIQVGLLVHSQAPWLGCSVDGLVLKGEQMEVLEIKCPILGQSKTASDVVQTLNYVVKKSGDFCLKEKHQYFGQAQLCMFLTHTEFCNFVIFSSFDNTFIHIRVPFNSVFTRKFICTLSNVYFQNILPRLSVNTSNF